MTFTDRDPHASGLGRNATMVRRGYLAGLIPLALMVTSIAVAQEPVAGRPAYPCSG